MSKIGSTYQHFVPMSRPHPEYPGCNKHHLVKSIDELKQVLETRGDFMAWDTETSSLSPEEGEIVGFSFAFSGTEGWYVPVNHIGCKYNLGHEGLELFYQRLLKCRKTFVYNMRFDFRFMEYAGFDMSKVPYLDVSIPVFMSDTNYPLPSLKESERRFLGWDPSTFEETLGDAVSFQYLDPEEGYVYACVDAEGTFALMGAVAQYYKEAKFCCDLDNAVLFPLMKFEDNPLKIDVKALRKMADDELVEIEKLSKEIYDAVGYEFEIQSNKQLGEALSSLGINTGHFTAKGQMKVDIKTLTLMVKDHPVLSKIIERSKKVKAVNSYMLSLADQAEKRGNAGRFAYLTTRVPTGRMASGGDKKNPYFMGSNIQSMPKPSPCMWYVHDWVDGTVLEPGEVRVDKWFFSLTRPSDYQIEGFSPKNNIRSAFVVDDGCYWVSCDYSAEELRIVANLSNEEGWIKTMLEGGDLHKYMAIQMWGQENYTKALRKKAKTANFGLIYLMKPFSMPDKFNEPLDVCEDIYNRFWKSIPNVKAFQDKIIRRARRLGTVYNYLGRPRRVRYWFNSGNGRDIAFGCRTVVNTVVQSMGGEVLKISMMKLWQNLYNVPKYRDAGVRFMNTIHDEINTQVPANLLHEVVAMKKKCMTRKFPNWRLPIDIGLEIGVSWGLTFPFEFDNEEGTEFHPKMEPVRK